MKTSEQTIGLSAHLIKAHKVCLNQIADVAKNTVRHCSGLIASNPVKIKETLGSYERFFVDCGFNCPLASQFKRTLKSGLPTIFPALDLLLAVEMGFGVLAGLQNAAPIQGEVRLRVLENVECFQGMRGLVNCRVGEIVIEDSQGIIASVFQGPDLRTKLESTSDDLLAIVFGAPESPPNVIDAAKLHFAEAFAKCSEGVEMQSLCI